MEDHIDPGARHPRGFISLNQPGLDSPHYNIPIGLSLIRLMKSAAPRVEPLRYFTVMSNSWSFNDHRAKRPTEALSASRYFKALWSVSRVNGLPNRRVRWFSVAQTTAKHSRSVVVYCCWARSRVLLLKQTGRSEPSGWIWDRTAPRAYRDASVYSTVGCSGLKLKWTSTSGDWNISLMVLMASSWAGPHSVMVLSFLSREVRSCDRSAYWGTKCW